MRVCHYDYDASCPTCQNREARAVINDYYSLPGLTITRKRGESILIGDDIVVRFHSLDGKQAKITITAPKTTKVSRAEAAHVDGHDFDVERFR